MIQTLTTIIPVALPEEATTIILLLLLIALFVTAYKVLSIVMQTAIISVLSTIFYLALWYLNLMPFSISNMLLFTFLGPALYITFKVASTTKKISVKAINIPIKIIKTVHKSFKKTFEILKPSRKRKEQNEEKDAKEVVIDKVNKEKQDN